MFLLVMCYSAMVLQNAKKAALQFGARIDFMMYKEIFARREAGEKLYLNKALEVQFTQAPQTEEEKEINELIAKWHTDQLGLLEAELFKQSKRAGDAQRMLSVKQTNKAEKELRIATKKIGKLKREIRSHQTNEIISESEERIFPLHYLSMLCLDENGQRVIRPVRYLMRPHNRSEAFDSEFSGCYNARFDNLETVPWWKDSFGKRHGIILVRQFYENVAVEKYRQHHPLPETESNNVVLCFKPEDREYMVIPTLWDKWQSDGKTLYSAALITDQPAPEIAQAGHDRTPILLQEQAIDDWLTIGKTAAELREILNRREFPRYGHRVMLAA